MSETSDKREPDKREGRGWPWWLGIICFGILAFAGIALLLISFPAPRGVQPMRGIDTGEFSGAGATLLAASVAGLAALVAIERWSEQRRKAVDLEVWKIRAEYYDVVVVACLQQFTKDYIDPNDLAVQRGHIALWGSEKVIQALEKWDVAAREAVEFQQTRAPGLPDDIKKSLWNALASLVDLMREELPGGAGEAFRVDKKRLLRMIFADYRALDDMGKAD